MASTGFSWPVPARRAVADAPPVPVTARLALRTPAARGLKATVSVHEAPAPNDRLAHPLVVRAKSEAAAPVTVTAGDVAPVPVFRIVTVCGGPAAPTRTVPKSSDDGEADS